VRLVSVDTPPAGGLRATARTPPTRAPLLPVTVDLDRADVEEITRLPRNRARFAQRIVPGATSMVVGRPGAVR